MDCNISFDLGKSMPPTCLKNVQWRIEEVQPSMRILPEKKKKKGQKRRRCKCKIIIKNTHKSLLSLPPNQAWLVAVTVKVCAGYKYKTPAPEVKIRCIGDFFSGLNTLAG